MTPLTRNRAHHANNGRGNTAHYGLRDRRGARAMPPPPPKLVPATVVARPEVLRTIAAACAASGDRETGGPLFGTVARTWDRSSPGWVVAVLGAPPPGPALDGRHASVTLGEGADGERERAALRWLRDVTRLDLVHVGEWHKHPSGMPAPSAGDRATAHALQREALTPVWVEAVAVGKTETTERLTGDGNVARLRRGHGNLVEVRFFRADGAGGLVPQPVSAEAVALPTLPSLPWHVLDPARFAAECRLLDAAGFTVQVAPNGATDPLGLTLRLTTDDNAPLIVRTGAGFPREAPVVLNGRGVAHRLRRPWSSGRFLLDAVREVG